MTVENFVLPLLLYSACALVGCLIAKQILDISYDYFLTFFLMTTFGFSLVGRIVVLDFFSYPKNIWLSLIAIVFPLLSAKTWPQDKCKTSDDRLTLIALSLLLLSIAIFTSLKFKYMLTDSAISENGSNSMYLIFFLVGMQIFLAASALYFLKVSRKS
jgi:hypothetical protein